MRPRQLALFRTPILATFVTFAVGLSGSAEALTWGSILTGTRTDGVPKSSRGVCQQCTMATFAGNQVADNHWMTVCNVFENNPDPDCAQLARDFPPLTVWSNWIGGGTPDVDTDVIIGPDAGETSLRPQGNSLVILTGIARARRVQSQSPLRMTSNNAGLFISSTAQASNIDRFVLEDGGQVNSNFELVLGTGPSAEPNSILRAGTLTQDQGGTTKIVNKGELFLLGDAPDPFTKVGLFVDRFENDGIVNQSGHGFSTNSDTEISNNDGAVWAIVSEEGAVFGGSSEPFVNHAGATLQKETGTSVVMQLPLLNDGGTVRIFAGRLNLRCAANFGSPGVCTGSEFRSGTLATRGNGSDGSFQPG